MNESKYEMILYWDRDDKVFVAEVPELPGCMAHGSTKSKAVQAAEAAISLYGYKQRMKMVLVFLNHAVSSCMRK